AAAAALIDRAAQLADELRTRYLEVRNTWALEHPRLSPRVGTKVHMRLPLPGSVTALWEGIPGKPRNLVRKARQGNLTVVWGGADLLQEFYGVFARNMR